MGSLIIIKLVSEKKLTNHQKASKQRSDEETKIGYDATPGMLSSIEQMPPARPPDANGTIAEAKIQGASYTIKVAQLITTFMILSNHRK